MVFGDRIVLERETGDSATFRYKDEMCDSNSIKGEGWSCTGKMVFIHYTS